MDKLIKAKAPVGTKPELITKIKTSFNQPSPLNINKPLNGESFNILSIDLGLKNFAYTRIQLDKNLPFNKPIIIKEWNKLDINAITNISDYKQFDPKIYSKVCYDLVENVLFNKEYDRPDIILIERQRARTLGSIEISEWVLKINMFESMLYGVLYSKLMNETPLLINNLISTNPQKMGGYFKPDIDRKLLKDSKTLRIILVEKWLKDMLNEKIVVQPKFLFDPIQFPQLINNKKIINRGKWINELILGSNRIQYNSKDNKKKFDNMKGDDLCDSLLHSLAWIDWEKNKMILKMELKLDLEEGLRINDQLYTIHFAELEFLKKYISVKS
ncbi:hypothetical protein WICMUC_005984 [Wickerhamomyces mucosus]|uniref:Mitochondrial resolvase Ydc2 catalytic domain-containing protein n=1 Tax=Wickerhamomyces mucosus TaxID=1378264 RepID=A0A9P8P089_9ASCO|nr:hypothetical protein WICMUC_005984 [Wickerhamomyces mucosus]